MTIHASCRHGRVIRVVMHEEAGNQGLREEHDAVTIQKTYFRRGVCRELEAMTEMRCERREVAARSLENARGDRLKAGLQHDGVRSAVRRKL